MAPPTHAAAPAAPVAHAPAAPVATSVLSRAPQAAQHVELGEDPRALVRAAVGEALAPVQQAFREIQRRLDELERRPLVVAPAPAAAAGSPDATSPGDLPRRRRRRRRRPPASVVPVSMAPIPMTMGSIAPRPPVLDVAAIERDRSVSIDGAIDGRRRKLKIAITFTLLLLAVFGGLFAALAYSYTPHSSGMLQPTNQGAALASAAPVARQGTGFVG